MKKKNTQNPPDGMSFYELINQIWDHGLGNELAEEGVPTPWTANSFEAAFFTIGFDVDRRSFQNWRQGKYKADRRNIHAIAKVVSAGDHKLQSRWATAMFHAPKVHPTEDDDVVLSKIQTLQLIWQNYRQFIIGILCGLIPFVVILTVFFFQWRSRTMVTSFEICNEAGFSKSLFKCTEPASYFPAAPGRVYFHFELPNSKSGEPFSMKWYQNSQFFHNKASYYDDVWPGYGYLQHERLKQPGRYSIRLTIENRTFVKTFIIEEFNPEHMHPDSDPD